MDLLVLYCPFQGDVAMTRNEGKFIEDKCLTDGKGAKFDMLECSENNETIGKKWLP